MLRVDLRVPEASLNLGGRGTLQSHRPPSDGKHVTGLDVTHLCSPNIADITSMPNSIQLNTNFFILPCFSSSVSESTSMLTVAPGLGCTWFSPRDDRTTSIDVTRTSQLQCTKNLPVSLPIFTIIEAEGVVCFPSSSSKTNHDYKDYWACCRRQPPALTQGLMSMPRFVGATTRTEDRPNNNTLRYQQRNKNVNDSLFFTSRLKKQRLMRYHHTLSSPHPPSVHRERHSTSKLSVLRLY